MRLLGVLLWVAPVFAQGQFAFSKLEPGIYAVVADLQGWNEATPETTVRTDPLGRFEIRDPDPGFYYVVPRAGSPWDEIILGSGQTVTGIKIQISGK